MAFAWSRCGTKAFRDKVPLLPLLREWLPDYSYPGKHHTLELPYLCAAGTPSPRYVVPAFLHQIGRRRDLDEPAISRTTASVCLGKQVPQQCCEHSRQTDVSLHSSCDPLPNKDLAAVGAIHPVVLKLVAVQAFSIPSGGATIMLPHRRCEINSIK